MRNPARQPSGFAKVEKKAASLMLKPDMQQRIAKDSIHQHRGHHLPKQTAPGAPNAGERDRR
jgi:hypothetical protein